jgi:transcriptional regulator with XRE-family HTH domain
MIVGEVTMLRHKLIAYRGTRSQAELGNIYGVTQQAWSKWERGIDAPKPHIMKKIAADAGIPMEELFFDVFNNQKLLSGSETSATVQPNDAA